MPARILARLLYRLYAATGLLDCLQLWCLSVMAILQRPASWACN